MCLRCACDVPAHPPSDSEVMSSHVMPSSCSAPRPTAAPCSESLCVMLRIALSLVLSAGALAKASLTARALPPRHAPNSPPRAQRCSEFSSSRTVQGPSQKPRSLPESSASPPPRLGRMCSGASEGAARGSRGGEGLLYAERPLPSAARARRPPASAWSSSAASACCASTRERTLRPSGA